MPLPAIRRTVDEALKLPGLAIIAAYLDGTIMDALRKRARRELVDDLHKLSPEEAVLALLQQRLQHPAPAKQPRSKRQAA